MIPSFNLSSPSVTSSLGAHLHSTPLTSKALEEVRIRREQRAQAEQLGQQVFWVLDPSGVELMALMHKQSGMLYVIHLERQDWISAFNGATLT